MNFGLNTVCLQKLSGRKPVELFDITVENGFTGIEFRDEYPFSEELDNETVRYIRNGVQGNGMICSVHLSFYDLNPGSFRRDIRNLSVECHKKAVGDAAELGAGMVTVHGGKMSRSFYTPERQREVDTFTFDSLSRIREMCEEHGILLSVENMSVFELSKVYKSYTSPEDLSDLYKDMGGAIGVTLDFGHAVSLMPNVVEYIRRLGPEKISMAHLSDNDFVQDLHLGPGEGSIDYRDFVLNYIRNKWTFPLFLETKTFGQSLSGRDYLENLSKEVAGG